MSKKSLDERDILYRKEGSTISGYRWGGWQGRRPLRYVSPTKQSIHLLLCSFVCSLTDKPTPLSLSPSKKRKRIRCYRREMSPFHFAFATQPPPCWRGCSCREDPLLVCFFLWPNTKKKNLPSSPVRVNFGVHTIRIYRVAGGLCEDNSGVTGTHYYYRLHASTRTGRRGRV
jgi:hypothetical protein